MTLAENNYPVSGTDVNMDLSLTNLGVANASNITATMISQTPGFIVTQGSASCSALAVNGSQAFDNAFTVSIPQDAQDGEVANFQVTVNWGSGSSTKNVSFAVLAPNLKVTDKSVQGATPTAAIDPGTQATAHVTVSNLGHADASDIVVDVTCNYSGVVVTSPSQNVSWIGAQNSVNSVFSVQVGSNVPTVSIVPLYIHVIQNNVDHIDTMFLTVGRAVEDFESGDFSQFNWVNNNNPWFVTSTAPYAGNYCARSKQGLSNGTGGWWSSTPSQSALSITVNSTMEGELSYFRKVSSEEGYDKFKLYVDNNEMDVASGEESWTQKSFVLSAGTHTIKFAYEKDASQASGSDCAWIDNIIMPGIGTRVTEDTYDPVGIENHPVDAFAIAVYPNPTNGRLNIQSDNTRLAQVQVFDLFGKLLLTEEPNDNHTSLNLSNLANGVYIVRMISDNQGSITRKIVKQ